MNERIRELMIQSMVEVAGHNDVQKTYERFAELIVEECCDMFVKMLYNHHPSICAYEIKNHFGMEE